MKILWDFQFVDLCLQAVQFIEGSFDLFFMIYFFLRGGGRVLFLWRSYSQVHYNNYIYF